MKSILKTVFLVSFVTFISLLFMGVTKAIETEDSLQVYHIRSENDKIITDKKIFSFYEQNNEKLAVLIEEKQRKEKEEAERLEAERLEAERLEAERIAKEEEARRQAENNKIDYSIANTIESNSEVANFAMQFVGNPYVYGGTSLTNGADCSGFVMAVYANFGISLPRTTGGQAQSGYPVDINNIQAGDIISYGYNGYVSHSALYVGNGMIVHASTPELGIRIDNMNIMPIVTIRRIG